MRKELVQLGLVADDTFNRRSRVFKRIQRRTGIAVLVFGRVIKGEHVTSATEFTVVTVAVAEPEFVPRADTLTMSLVALSESVVMASMILVEFFGYFHPFTGGLEINTVRICILLHFDFLL
jgi:hypothetical protein